MLDNLAANWPYLILIGLTGGFLSSLMGIGGGIIIVPMLFFFASAAQREAQGLSLGYMIVTALTGFLLYKYNSKETLRLNYVAVALLTTGGVLGAFVGQYAADHIPTFWLKKMFAVLMIAVAVKLILERPKKLEAPIQPDQPVIKTVALESTTEQLR